ncbi:5-(carboxyamino)imidazole ribonucleotide synthase [Corynebacterium sp. 11A]|uniref:5-(carboxyamino)imidazole ribonucleotide synthase n=1 Tax=Corynebacterium sp. 11A TaxID=2080510 RepID=UPI00124EA30B|nr:5-(carboxyamino)imidazole ribonucleotide synthase [Corynebacterium sp. 11A]
MSAHAPGFPIVAVIGDGQLARMMQTAAIELGQSLRVLASRPDSSAAQVAHDVYIGDYTDLDDLRAVCAGADVVTFDHEHVPNEHQHTLIGEGVNIQPRPEALVYAQDKLLQRRHLSELGAPVPDFAAITSVADAREFFARVNGAVCLKARRGGYDGKGVWFIDSEEELCERVETLLAQGIDLMAETKVELRRELSAMVARRPSGECVSWPVVESVQENGVCALAVAPAPGLDESVEARTAAMARRVADTLGVTGVLAVELFETSAGEIFVNELAMRPHNTGHWTQDGCVTSQFEQHLRAVLDMPLGATTPTASYTVMANILGGEEDPELSWAERQAEVWKRYPQAKIHLYGKGYRPGRKIGHVNLSGEGDVDALRADARAAAYFMVHAHWPSQS